MIEGLGQAIGQAMVALFIIGIVCGVALVGVAWLLWRFVFSHLAWV